MDSFFTENILKFANYLYQGLSWITPEKDFLGQFSLFVGSLTASIVGILHPAFFVVYVHRDNAERIMARIGGSMSASYFLMSIVLLVGIIIKNPIILALYVFFIILFVTTAVIVMIVSGIRLCMQEEFRVSILSCMIFPLVLYACMIYLSLVVNAYRVQLQKEGHRGYKELYKKP